MAFGLFKNPFEALSAENQSSMVKNLEEIKDYFFKGNTIVQAVNNLGSLLEKNIKSQNTLTQILLKRQEKQMTDKDQKEMIKTAKVFGPALERIVGAIKDFSGIPEETVDKFILAIEKIARAFEKIKDIGKTIMDASKGLMLMAGAIILFGLALIISLPIYLLAIFAAPLVFAVVLGFIWLFTKALGDKTGKDILDGAKGLMYMAAAIALFGIVLYLAGIVYAELWAGVIGVIPILLTIGAMIFLFSFMDGFSDTLMDGVKVLFLMAAVIGLVGIILYLSSIIYEELWTGAIGVTPILLVIGALVGIMFLLDSMSADIYDGAKALAVMVLVVAFTAIILYVVGKYADEMVAGLGASWPILILIGALVGVMFLISKLEGQLLQGALAMAAMSGVLIILAGALYLLKDVDWGITDTLSLSALLIALGLIGTVLGALMEGGLLPLLGAAAIGAIGLALIPLAYALKIYKEADFGLADAALLSGTIIALGVIGTVLGNPFTIGFTLMGAGAMLVIGAAMEPLTQGLKTFKESGWSDSDGENFEKAIASIVRAFSIIADDDLKAKYGVKATAFELFWGIRSLAGIGNIMTELARGIQDFANMKFVEYEVVKDKDGNSKIQVKEIRKLTDGEIQSAGINFGKVLDAILSPISNVGRAEMMSEGWFSGGVVSKGIASLSGIGNIMTDLAKGIQSFADLKFTTYEIYTDKDGRTSIQPKEITQLTPKHFEDAGKGFKSVIDAIIGPISDVGRAEMNSDSWFSDGVVKKGVEALTGIGNIMTGLAKGIQDFAELKFTRFEVVGAGTADAKVVPKEMIQLDSGNFWQVKDNFNNILNAFFDPIIWAGHKYNENSSVVDKAVEVFPKITDVVNKIAEVTKPWAEMAEPWKPGWAFTIFTESIFKVFEKPNADQLLGKLGDFTDNVSVLIDGSSKLEKTADSFERIADAFGEMKDHINGMELERLTQVTQLMGFLDGLANGNSDDIVADIGEAITQGMETLKDILEEIKDQLGTASASGPGIVEQAANAIGIGPGTSEVTPAKVEEKQQQVDMTPVVNAINSLKAQLTTTGIKVQKGFPL